MGFHSFVAKTFSEGGASYPRFEFEAPYYMCGLRLVLIGFDLETDTALLTQSVLFTLTVSFAIRSLYNKQPCNSSTAMGCHALSVSSKEMGDGVIAKR